MEEQKGTIKFSLKGIIKYISTILSWTIFVFLILIGVLLIYYYVFANLYSKYGDKYEPKFSVYTIVSPSMEPTIKVYDVIINVKIDSIDQIKVNDVITFISDWEVNQGMTITHRVIGKKTLEDGKTCLITRGDNNTVDDQSCVKEGNIIGVTRGIIPSLGKVQLLLSKVLGWILLLILPAIYIILKDVFKIFKKSKNNIELPNINLVQNKTYIEPVINKESVKNTLQEKYNYLLEVRNKK